MSKKKDKKEYPEFDAQNYVEYLGEKAEYYRRMDREALQQSQILPMVSATGFYVSSPPFFPTVTWPQFDTKSGGESVETERDLASPEQAKEIILDCLLHGDPALIVGPPGIGKSALPRQVIAELGWDSDCWYVGTYNPTHFQGAPHVASDGKHAEFLPYGFNWKMMESTDYYAIIWDDFGGAVGATQLAGQQLLLDRKLNNVTVPDGVRFILTTNDIMHKAAANRVATSVISRCTVIRMTATATAWCKWAAGAGMPEVLVKYIEYMGDQALFSFAPGDKIENCPLPRNWEEVGKKLGRWTGSDEGLKLAVMGRVGVQRGIEFIGWRKIWNNMPDLNEILVYPDRAKLPEDQPGVMLATCARLVSLAKKDNLDKIRQYMLRFARRDYAGKIMSDIRKSRQDLVETQVFGQMEIDFQRLY